jgi:large subunit ribosomal protein L4
MKQISIKNLSGSEIGTIDLPEEIFDIDYNPILMNQYIRYCLLSQSSGTANTKNRSDVSGSGKKRRRQKKSGRARMGEIAPHHRGGPIAHGPRVVNKEELSHQKAVISKQISKKQKKLVLAMALTSKLREGKLMVVDNLSMDEPKSKTFRNVMIGLNIYNRALFVNDSTEFKKINNIDSEDPFCKFYLGARNFHKVRMASTFTMNVHTILKNESLIMTVGALNELLKRYGGKDE